MLTLYYTPGACSLSPHIALREANLPFTLEQVDLRAKSLASGGSFTDVNPKGYVPALRLEDGQILTEGAVMVQHIADLAPAAGLAPPSGTLARVRLQEWLHFLATELHKGYAPLYSPLAGDDYKAAVKERVTGRLRWLAGRLGDRTTLLDRFSVADGYLLYNLRVFKRLVAPELPAGLDRVHDAIAARPAVQAALAAEGLA